MKIAVDAMGGDYAPVEIIKGAVEAVKLHKLEVVLVGDHAAITKELAKYAYDKNLISVVHASEVIRMDEAPAVAVRKKRDSSIVVCNRLIKEGQADAVVSAGSTGAAMGASLLGLGRIKGIDRPAIASIIPTLTGYCLLLDVGANAECKPVNLVQFAIMGHIYAKKIMGIAQPRVGLLNIGEEESKGKELYVEAHRLLKESKLNFIGNIEGRDITRGRADVIVCDGFVGNVVLKFGEGLARDLMWMIKQELKKNIFVKVGAALVFTQAKGLKKRIDYAEYGGAPLLGVNGISIISHGSSDAKAIANAVRVAKECVEKKVVDCIRDSIHETILGDDEHARI
ncbi:phosphate acyltransferase PlsX [Thermincola potens]|uniref:Phosphate acyltransferase n=1 Tax=Thermincola potens (strain JR) TaxID=635013 RepID=D5X8P7_THEPJ|nr:phosphate acyltransferase PlsX [Thermincola potens]ADG82923.1 fatty acid/phospholipid synthesis protein PlsX [Thermincola potens JR]